MHPDPIRRLVRGIQDGLDDRALLEVLTTVLQEARDGAAGDAVGAVVDPGGVADEVRRIVRQAYWDLPLLPTSVLEAAVGDQGTLAGLAGRGPVLGSCLRCGRALRATHRDHLVRPVDRSCARCLQQQPTGATKGRPSGGLRGGRRWPPAGVGAPPESVAAVARGRRIWAEHYPDV